MPSKASVLQVDPEDLVRGYEAYAEGMTGTRRAEKLEGILRSGLPTSDVTDLVNNPTVNACACVREALGDRPYNYSMAVMTRIVALEDTLERYPRRFTPDFIRVDGDDMVIGDALLRAAARASLPNGERFDADVLLRMANRCLRDLPEPARVQ